MSFRASGTIRCWKKYDCLGCGAVYRHRFSRNVSGTGGTARAAEAGAQQAGMNALRNQVDSCPCPECGRVQPRMVGHAKAGAQTALALVLAGAMGLVLIFGSADVMNRDITALATAGIAGFGALAHLLCAWRDPNANPDANKSRTAQKVDDGEVEVLRTGDPTSGEPPPPLVTRSHLFYLGAALVAVPIALVPVAVRLANDWSLANTDPPVFGPGDQFRITFPDKIDCVKSTWAASPRVTFEGDVPGAVVTSNSDTWGMSMSVKTSEAHTSPTLWADVTLPNDDRLANRELRGRVDMTVRYPQANAARSMSDKETPVSRSFAVRLATPFAWRTYRRAWWGGLLGFFGVMVFASWGFIVLARHMKWDSPPDLVEPIGAPPSDQPPER